MLIAWAFSKEHRTINWRLILWGLVLQFVFALLVFVFPIGSKVFLWINDIVVAVMNSASAGSEFLFGPLALPPGEDGSLGFILAFQGLPTIIFFSAIMAILYYFGIMQKVISAFAWLFTKLLRVSGAESLVSASTIFVGVESSLTVRPYLEEMTESELNTILTAMMATVSSNVLAVYVFSLQAEFPTIAAHLVSASILSAPAALIMSKLIVPETGKPETLGEHVTVDYEPDSNLFTAIINGANTGVRLIVGIAALLVAVLGLVALVNLMLTGIGGWVNNLAGIGIDWSIEGLLGYAFYPLALLLGVPAVDAGVVAEIIGSRIIVTEVAAYQQLAEVLAADGLSSARSAVICSYALCGFAHVASLSIFIGGISAVAPKTTEALSRIGLRALLGATLATLMTGCIAGVFFMEGSILF
jgi:CNT family concentrative nucleoside transporter